MAALNPKTVILFPARAGVILPPCPQAAQGTAVPRTRGGDPLEQMEMLEDTDCSPHARG